MGFVLDTIKDVIAFWKTYLVEIVKYQMLFLVFFVIGFSLIVWPLTLPNLLVLSTPLKISEIINQIFSLNVILFLIPGIVIIILTNFTQLGGYTLFFYQLEKTGRINILEVAKESFKKVHKILTVVILIGLIFFVVVFLFFLPLLFLGFYFSFEYIIVMAIVGMLSLLLGLYIILRLSISLPILMIEGYGSIESLKKSWRITKGKVIRIGIASFIISIIAVAISGILNFIVSSVLVSTSLPVILYNIIAYLFLQPLTSFFPTIVYYNLRREI